MKFIDNINILVGKTLCGIEHSKYEIYFNVSDDELYKLYHSQDCCESVEVEEIIGDLNNLIGSPIIMAEEVTYENEISEGMFFDEYGEPESYTWTFYKLATVKGYVTIRWYGSSNGYYSESVSFCKVDISRD